jgi:MFS family permease
MRAAFSMHEPGSEEKHATSAGMHPASAREAPSALGRGLAAHLPALRHRNFRLFVAGQGVSLIGFWMQSVAQGWLVYRLSGSAFWLGMVAFSGYLPILCFAPFAGVLVDHVRRRRLLVLTQTILMLLAVALGTLAYTGLVTVRLIAILAACVGLVSAFDVPARQAFLVEMVGPGDLPGAIALNSSLFNSARVVGPAIAGIVVAQAGETPCFFLNAATYLAVLWALVRMRLAPSGPLAPRPPLGAGFVDGVRYVWGDRALRNLLLLLGVIGALGLQYQILMPVFAGRVFVSGVGAYGLLLTAGGVGAVASALRLASHSYTGPQHRQNLLLGLSAFAVGVLGLAASPMLAVALVFQAVAGFGMIRYTATTNTMLQLLVDDRYRGRMMALHTVMFLGTAPVGSLLLGTLADQFGARRAALLSGTVALVAALWLATRLRRLAARERRAAARLASGGEA